MLYTTTPLFIGIRDNFGLIALIKLWPILNYLIKTPNSTIFKKNNNPFVVPDDYLAAIL